MTYHDIISLYPELHAMSGAELQHLCSTADVEPDIHEHLQETRLWWAPTITAPNGDVLLIDPPGTVPEPERLGRAAQRGTFLAGD